MRLNLNKAVALPLRSVGPFWQPFVVGTFDAVCDGTLGARAAAMDQLWTAMGYPGAFNCGRGSHGMDA